MKIGYQGVFGSYSSEAAFKYFCGESGQTPIQKTADHEFINFAKFEDVFNAVSTGAVDRGVIPLENSYAGRVAEIHNLFPQYNLYIVGEYVLPVKHKLLALPDTQINDIRQIYSHEQALMQCVKSIDKTFAGKTSPVTNIFANTAIAAKHVAQVNDKSLAAIASPFAAKLYNLQILVDNFADSPNNYTTFVIIAKDPIFASLDDKNVVSSMIFTVRNIPAAIYKAIGGFATNNVDLIKLESYIPGGISSSAAQFFLSFKGHVHQKNVRLAIEELGFFATKTALLGCYKSDNKRFE